jgi:hypothetical protein
VALRLVGDDPPAQSATLEFIEHHVGTQSNNRD